MKLTELEAEFVRYVPRPPTAEELVTNPQWSPSHIIDCFQIEGVSINEAHGLLFICPKSRAENKDHYLQVFFRGSPVPDRLGKNKDGKTVRWDKSGTSMADLSLQPSIQEQCDCAWHGHVTLGDAA